MRMQTAPTPMDHMYAIVSLDILEMDKIAQVNSELKEMRSWMINFLVRSFSFCLYNVFCALVSKQEQFITYALNSLCCTKVWKFEK